jgi:hypothetical protein
MSFRRVLVPLVVAGASLVIGAAPALAAGPPVPTGCTFDKATGVLTCVTTTTSNTTVLANTGGFVSPPATVDGFTVQQVCDGLVAGPSGSAILLDLVNFTLDVKVTTTTRTERNGLAGKVFDTSTATSSVITGGSPGAQGQSTCLY